LGIPSFCLRCHHCSNASVLLIKNDRQNDFDMRCCNHRDVHSVPYSPVDGGVAVQWARMGDATDRAAQSDRKIDELGRDRSPTSACYSVVNCSMTQGLRHVMKCDKLGTKRTQGQREVCIYPSLKLAKNWRKSQTFVVRINGFQTHNYNVNLFYRKGTTQ